jgi:hypothetical protein
MSINHPIMNESYVPAYQISATPFVTSSTVSLGQVKEIEFPQVTRFVVIKNTSLGTTSTSLAVSFTENGLKPENSNYFILNSQESFEGEIRTNKLFVSGSAGPSCGFSIVAGLTFIPSYTMTTITGSNGFQGVG